MIRETRLQVWNVCARRRQVETLFGPALLACVGGMHVKTIRAAVDLRRAHLHQRNEARLEAPGHGERSAHPGLHQGRSGGEQVV
ncbi:hypothetical protein C7410_1263 [Paraburkholderia silvatlantica]|uniref:Uncharacterized protein n=1 Tax=Paraburkholderia silvatlantica TaxID=321895 RepID=A0A2V4T280_9BURK|nr:hypothetical protein C7410_1263 [Paraburkholderia silvatlantica]TDQ81204.1 hypothetical protein C7412_126114 [Paraburkholderia silvatlantica]